MCGLAGFVRHPRGNGFGLSKAIVSELLYVTRHRGRHATGVAAVSASGAEVSKWAVDPAKLLPSKTWGDLMKSTDRNTRILIGHIRHATFSNSTVDAAAHPYAEGRTVGAHNGVIRNWKDLLDTTDEREYHTDSEAVIALLDSMADDAAALLSELRGSFALTWAREGKLYMIRNAERPLACAYVPSMRTLFWCSERGPLGAVLHGRGLKEADFAIWEAKSGVLYAYDPNAFDENSTNGKREEIKLYVPEPQTEFGWWDRDRPEQNRRKKSRRKKSRHYRSFDALSREGRIDDIDSLVDDLESRLEDALGRIEGLEAEVEHLLRVVDRAGLLGPDPCVACGGVMGDLLDGPEGPVHEACIFEDPAALGVGIERGGTDG